MRQHSHRTSTIWPSHCQLACVLGGLAGVLAAIVVSILTASPAAAVELRAIADVPEIRSHRMTAVIQFGEPPLQKVEVDGAFQRDPAAQELSIAVYEGDQSTINWNVRKVGDTFYMNGGRGWGKVESFRFDELVVVTPEHFLEIGDALTEEETTTLNGRDVILLRGEKGVLPKVQSGSDSIDFSKMLQATLNLWVDTTHHFVVKMHIAALAEERGQALPIDVRYEYSHFNDVAEIVAPSPEESLPAPEPPASSSQEEVDAKLGFHFALPENAHVSINGATVSILTKMPLEKARTYIDRSMTAAGFTRKEETERHPGEFFTDWETDGRTLGTLAFQVTEAGATIQVNAIKH